MIGIQTTNQNEIIAYTIWVNYYLQRKHIEIKDIFNDFKDGTNIIQLVELIYNEEIKESWDSNPTSPKKMKENIQIAFNFLSSKNLHLYGISPDDIVNNKKNAILNLIWNLIEHSLIKSISYKNMTGKAALLLWCKEVTIKYTNVKIVDFSRSWINCLGFCAIINHFSPQSLDYYFCNEVSKPGNLKLFTSSLQKLGIVSFISPSNYNDINSEKIFMIQLSFLFNFFTKNDKPVIKVESKPIDMQTKQTFVQPTSQIQIADSPKPPITQNQNNETKKSPKSIIIPPPSGFNQKPPNQKNTLEKVIQHTEMKQPSPQPKSQNDKANIIPPTSISPSSQDVKTFSGISQFKSQIPDAPIQKIHVDKSKFNFETICKEIINNENKINTNGKDIVIFVGRTQCGKSTSINCLLGAKYEITSDDKLKCQNEKQLDLAEIGKKNIGKSSTIIPKSYAISNDLVLLDTQGFFDTRESHDDQEVIGSLLLEIAIRNAKSVRAVCVIKWSDFESGISGMKQNGEIISRLFVNNENEMVPIFFLFNRFFCVNDSIYNNFLSKDTKRIDFVKERAKEKTKEIKKDLVESEEKQKDIEYFLFDYNISRGNAGYIDVLKPKIIEATKKKLSDIPIISKDHIQVYRSSKVREVFNIHMVYKLTLNYQKMLQHLLSLKYPKTLFDSILKQIQTAASIIAKQIDALSNTRYVDEFDISLFDKKETEITESIEECDSKISNIKDQIIQLENSNDENLSVNIQTIDNGIIQDLQNQKQKIEDNIQDLTRQISKISSNLENAKKKLDEFDKNYESALREKNLLLKDLEKDRDYAQKSIYDINHIIEDMNQKDPDPVFDKNYYAHRLFKETFWEVNFDEGIIYDYENPKEIISNRVKKQEIEVNNKQYHVKYVATQWIDKKMYVDLKLYTWKKYKPDKISYLRAKQKELNSCIEQIKRDEVEINEIKEDLKDFTTSSQILRNVQLRNQKEIIQQKTQIENELSTQRELLINCKTQLENKTRKIEMIEKENQNKIEQIEMKKKSLQLLTQKREKLIQDKKVNEEKKIKSKKEHDENMNIEEEKKKQTQKRLSSFNQQLEKYQETIKKQSQILEKYYINKQYDILEVNHLVIISKRLLVNSILCNEIMKIQQIIKQASAHDTFNCEIINENSAINPELDQNIWLTNNITKQKTSIFCFIQEINNDLTIFDKWSAEVDLYETS